MELELRSAGGRTKALCTEMVNILSQMRRLMKKPAGRLSNTFRIYGILTAASAVLLVLSAVLLVLDWSDRATILCAVFMLFLTVFCAFTRYRLGKLRSAFLADQQGSVLRLDADGMEVRRDDGRVTRAAWSSLTALRIFKESACFLPKSETQAAFLISKEFLPQVLDYVKAQHPEIAVYGA